MRPDLRTRFVLGLAARTGRPVEDLTPADLERSRLPPHRSRLSELVIGRLAPGVAVEDVHVPGGAGEVRARIYRPLEAARAADPLPVVAHLHGGGFVGGSHHADWLGSEVAARVGALVVSVDYRLSPEHRSPAALDDAVAATAWLGSPAARVLGADPSRIAVMGESAGATLAAVAARVLRDRGGPRLRAQVLAYPATDATLSAPSLDRLGGRRGVLTRRDLEAYLRHHLGEDADPRSPDVSPLHAPDLRRLPRALVQTAEHDPLLDDGLRYAERLAAAGVPVRATTYVGASHGFLALPGVERWPAEQAVEEIRAELAAAFAGA